MKQIMALIFSVLLLLGGMNYASAQGLATGGGTSAAVNQYACPTPQALLTNPSGYTLSNGSVNATTFVGIILGQSIHGDHLQGLHTVTQDVRMVNVCGDGLVYVHQEPMLGTSFTVNGYQGWNSGYGTLWGDVGDLMITGGTTSHGKTFSRVIWANQAYAGQAIATFMPGGSTGYALALAFNSLNRVGIPGSRVDAIIIGEGESDGIAGTSQASYQASMQTWFKIAKGFGFAGKILVNLETYAYGCTSSTIRAAQAAVVDNVSIWQGGDFDTLVTTTNRYAEIASGGCATNALVHFNSTGRPAAAALEKAAIFLAF